MKLTLTKKPGAHAGIGTVQGITHGSEYDDDADDSAEVTVRHGPKARTTKGPTLANPTRRSHVHVPGHVARKLKVGQRVRIHIEPVG